MRIECTQCSAKYNVSEEKLEKGEVRLKCKQCRTLLVIDESGNVQSADAASGQAATSAEQQRSSAPPDVPTSGRDATSAESQNAGSQNAESQNAESQHTGSQDPGSQSAERQDEEHRAADSAEHDDSDQVAPDSDRETETESDAGADERRSRPSNRPARPRLDPSDAHATIPLPPLDELGLGPGRQLGGGPLPPPAVGRPIPGVTPPPPSAVVPDADLDADRRDAASGTTRKSTPPRPLPAPQTPMVTTPSEAPTLFLGAQSSGQPATPATVTLSFRLPPVKKWGWGLLAALVLLGLLIGAALTVAPDRSHLEEFDPVKARQAFSDATGRSLGCFEEGIPDLEGEVELLVNPDGEVESFNARGKIASSVRVDCVRNHFEAIQFEPFNGAAVRVQRSISIGNPSVSTN